FLTAAGSEPPDLALTAQAGPELDHGLYALAADAAPVVAPEGVLLERYAGETGTWLLAVGPEAQIRELDRQMRAIKARPVPLPEWLPPSRAEAVAAVAQRLAVLRERLTALGADLAGLSNRFGLADALGKLAVLGWIADHAADLEASGRLIFITGWTTEAGAAAIAEETERRGVRCVIGFPEPPAGVEPPLVMHNPRFARLFEIFPRMLGMPGRFEVDPSMLVAVIAPLLFGYMFGDLGHGLALTLAGIIIGRQHPLARILIPCGVSAMLFGLLFGSVFGLEHIVPALWLHPIEDPITVLAVPLAGGFILLAGGLLLDGLEAHWRGRLRIWTATNAGIFVAYIGVAASFVVGPGALALTAIGLLWYVVGATLTGDRSLATAGAALGHMVESFLQLLVNTLSFARVGAFALAHAGLSLAVYGMAEAAGPIGFWIVLAIGNIVV
ncbi:MAG: hypothetical protein KDJ16_12545, partial [Hyphomicrobiales bacterium]|nr:hypothetical protein [Hyphomicrobiales bacterium]